MIIRCKIDVTKIDKTAIFEGKKGKYVDITLLENREGPDQYGNDFMVVQELSKERREAGEKGAILGNGKKVDVKAPNRAPPAERPGRTVTTPPPQPIKESRGSYVPPSNSLPPPPPPKENSSLTQSEEDPPF